MYQDTIAAISTPIGEGGIGIVRLSGPEAKAIVMGIFPRKKLTHRRLVYGHIVDPENREVVDEVLVAYMAAPHTYTREDMVEINAHGGPVALQRILGLALKFGARLAQPGEFTLRAFLNGRLDLAQAEAVLDIVQARTEASLRLAVQGLGGRLSAQIKGVRQEVMAVLAYLTARVDFPEEDIPEEGVVAPLKKAQGELRRLVAGAEVGMVYRLGVRTAIVGKPNVGKSSLLNRLLRESRAIVSPVPGTTRDTVEEVMNLGGVPFLLIDTAGISQSEDLVERLGVERSRKAIASADLALLVVDASQPLESRDREMLALLEGRKALVAANKCDLPRAADLSTLPWRVVYTSALTGEGLEELEKEMLGMVLGGGVVASDAPLVANPRHKEALERALKHLGEALKGLEAGLPEDFVIIDLASAASALGEITGETVTSDLLEAIFSRFCIGK